jgi:hypothetical protein
MVGALQREPGFGQLQYRSHQICFVQNFAQREGNQTLSIMQVSSAFGYQPIRVKAALNNRLEEPKVRDRHMAIDKNSEVEILEWINIQIEKCNPVTHTDLRHYCEVKYSTSISRGWIDAFILRHRDDLTETKSTSQEKTRLEVPRVFLDETIYCL